MGNDWLLIGFAAFVLTGTGLAAALAAGERKSLPIAVQAWAAAVALALLAAGGACAVLHRAPRMGDLYRVKVPKAGCGHQASSRRQGCPS